MASEVRGCTSVPWVDENEEEPAFNRDTIVDRFGESPDVIELYNSGNDPVDLAGHFLSDDRAEPKKWIFPVNSVIQPKDYFIVFASGREDVPPAKHLETIIRPGDE